MQPGDFNGAFFQAGVAELTMACMCIGMYLHGGVIPACGTFFVFSDYMKPAVRMAALMEVPIKFIWTHDAFRVGEDGPDGKDEEPPRKRQCTCVPPCRCKRDNGMLGYGNGKYGDSDSSHFLTPEYQ